MYLSPLRLAVRCASDGVMQVARLSAATALPSICVLAVTYLLLVSSFLRLRQVYRWCAPWSPGHRSCHAWADGCVDTFGVRVLDLSATDMLHVIVPLGFGGVQSLGVAGISRVEAIKHHTPSTLLSSDIVVVDQRSHFTQRQSTLSCMHVPALAVIQQTAHPAGPACGQEASCLALSRKLLRLLLLLCFADTLWVCGAVRACWLPLYMLMAGAPAPILVSRCTKELCFFHREQALASI